MTYYIAINDQQKGPFSIEELKSHHLKKDTMVWAEGWADWTEAGSVPELVNILENAPPQLADEKPGIVQHNYFGYELASPMVRLVVSIVNSIIPIAIMYWIFQIDFSTSGLTQGYGMAPIFISALVGGISYSLWSGGIGHALFGLKVISAIDGKDQRKFMDGVAREVLKLVYSYALIPTIWLLWDEHKQNLYDKAVHTYVVKQNRTPYRLLHPNNRQGTATCRFYW